MLVVKKLGYRSFRGYLHSMCPRTCKADYSSVVAPVANISPIESFSKSYPIYIRPSLVVGYSTNAL